MFLPNLGFQIMSLLFPLMFLLVFGTIIVSLIRGLKEWNHNNNSPRLTVEAEVVAKRNEVTRRRNAANNHTHRTTRYYATFQVASGDRMELLVQGHEFGLLVEGDRGKLTFQGTRYLGFERTII